MFAETPRSRSDHRFEHRSDRSNHYDRGDAGDARIPNFSQFSRSLAPDVSSLHSMSSRGLTEAAFGLYFCFCTISYSLIKSVLIL